MSIDTQAYLFVHFIGEERNPTDEQLDWLQCIRQSDEGRMT